ncbi:hypothetical protein F4604DRAFT_1931519 [Suillus subluteus]|nr:hypothetical protein F4604DRAFT_1931519 [Suillus subluteus]
MSPTAPGAGRPVPSFITDNFNHGKKVDNKYGHYYWSCKHCPDAVCIQGRDSQLPNHLIHKCKKCPAEIQKQAHMFVINKAGGEDAIEFINSDNINASPTTQGSSKLVVLGKCKKGPLSGYMDYPLTKEQHSCVNVKLLWFIIDANIAFSAVHVQQEEIDRCRDSCLCRRIWANFVPFHDAPTILATRFKPDFRAMRALAHTSAFGRVTVHSVALP